MSYQQEYQSVGEPSQYTQPTPTGPPLGDTVTELPAEPPKTRGQELLENLGGVIIVLFGCSIVVMTQAALNCGHPCEDRRAYSVAIGAASAIVTLIYLMLARINKMPSNGRFILAVFMFIWWTVGAGVLTFPGGMFVQTGNGYFGAWGAWCCSAWLMKAEYSRLQSFVERMAELGLVSWLLLGSVVELCAAIAQCDTAYECKDYDAWALTSGILSVVVSLALIFVPPIAAHIKYVSMFMVLWWIAGAGINTFKGPFQATGNGFFSSWACLIASVFMLQPHMGWGEGVDLDRPRS